MKRVETFLKQIQQANQNGLGKLVQGFLLLCGNGWGAEDLKISLDLQEPWNTDDPLWVSGYRRMNILCVPSLFKKFTGVYSCFTTLYQFLLYNEANQLYVCTYTSLPLGSPLSPAIMPSALQVITEHQAELPVLYSRFPPTIYFTHGHIYIRHHFFPNLSHLSSPPLHVHMSVFYVCVSIQFSSVAQSCPTLCDPINHSTPGLPVHHQLPEFTQTHVH